MASSLASFSLVTSDPAASSRAVPFMGSARTRRPRVEKKSSGDADTISGPPGSLTHAAWRGTPRAHSSPSSAAPGSGPRRARTV